jgi:O-antigen/teichoic acid export membrane protein
MDERDSTKPRTGLGRLSAAAEKLLPRSRLGRNAIVASSGHLGGHALMVLVTPLLTRLCTPADFALFTVYTAMVSLVGLSSTLRFEAAIPLPAEEKTAGHLVLLAAGACGLTSLVTGLVLWSIGRSVLGWFQASELADWWMVFAVHLGSIGCYEAMGGWWIRRGTFGPLARSRVIISAASALVQLAGALLVGGFLGLVLGPVVGSLLGVLYLIAGLRKDWAILGDFRPRDLWAVAVRYRRFPQYSVASSLVQKMTVLLPPLALAALYQPDVVGWFGMAQRTLVVPLSLLGVPLSRVYMAEASRIHRDGSGSLRRLFAQTLRKQLLLAGVPLGLFALSAPWVFTLAFGANWREAGIYCTLLCPMLVLYVTNVVLATTLEVLERLELQLRRSVVSIVCIAVGILAPKFLDLSPRAAVLTLSVASSIGYLYTLWTIWRAIPRNSGRMLPGPHAVGVREQTAAASARSPLSSSHAAFEVRRHA